MHSPSAPTATSTGDHTLVLERKKTIADGVVELLLYSAAPLPVWAPGAHIDLVFADDLIRQYSLCGDPADRHHYRLGILREPAGRGGSAFAHDWLDEGAAVVVRGPRNHFPLVTAPGYRFVAGGIGITPILPMIRAAEAAGADWQLLYGGRRHESMEFLDELESYGTRVRFQPEDTAGRLDLDALLATPLPDTVIYSCGPEALLQAVEQRCSSWPAGSLHLERFAAVEQDHSADTAFEVVFEQSGVTATVPAGVSILDVAAEHGVFALRSCSEGVCGTCETVLLDGEPDHRDAVLSAEDRADNCFIPCVSRCRSARLVLDL